MIIANFASKQPNDHDFEFKFGAISFFRFSKKSQVFKIYEVFVGIKLKKSATFCYFLNHTIKYLT